jgi:hypothetical protein
MTFASGKDVSVPDVALTVTFEAFDTTAPGRRTKFQESFKDTVAGPQAGGPDALGTSTPNA